MSATTQSPKTTADAGVVDFAPPVLEVPQPTEPATPVVPDAPATPVDPDPGTPAAPEEPSTVPGPEEPATPAVPEPDADPAAAGGARPVAAGARR